MKPTDIAEPDYFHKVVDCQWACPAHTPVPEYIRLIAAGRYGDAYLVNWKSNVFPGILGRTCDRPCEPACSRGRVEEGGDQEGQARAGRDLPPEARRRRLQGRHSPRSCRSPRPQKNGKRDRVRRRRSRVAHRRARSRAARLRARRVRRRRQGGRHDAHADPEVPLAGERDRRGGGLHPRPRRRFPPGAAHRQHARRCSRKASTRSSSAAARRAAATSTFRAARKPRRTSTSASTGCRACRSATSTRIGKRVVVLGGGNTAMDCCRSAQAPGRRARSTSSCAPATRK